MKKTMLFILVLVLAVVIGAIGLVWAQGTIIKPLQYKVLDITQIESQKINLSSLPDSQLIRIGTVTKSLGELRQNRSLVIARDQQIATSYAQLVQSNFTKRKNDLMNMYAARDSKNSYILKEMLSKFPGTAIPTFNTTNLPLGTLINPPGPPQFASIDKNQGQKDVPFLIEGTNFQVFMVGLRQEVVKVKPRVLILVAAGVFMDAIVQAWSNTQIMATVPDTTGYPGYSGYIYVETKVGKSEFRPFRVDPDLDLVMLDSYLGTHTLTPCNSSDDPRATLTFGEFGTPQTHDHIVVCHNVAATRGCSYTDSLWQGITLRNGWAVDTVNVYKITESNDVYANLQNYPVGTNNPMLQIGWKINAAAFPILDYYASVIITGPKGTSWK